MKTLKVKKYGSNLLWRMELLRTTIVFTIYLFYDLIVFLHFIFYFFYCKRVGFFSPQIYYLLFT